MAKYITETYITGNLEKREAEFYNVNEYNNEPNFRSSETKTLLEEIEN